MGIDIAAAKKLVEHAARHPEKGRVLMLGRHKMQLRPHHEKLLEKHMAEHGLDLSFADVSQPDGYSERFFEHLGYGEVAAMDLSDYEGAQHLHDLNDPLPEAMAGQWDLVYDGGTAEHVFDVATCMDNIFKLIAPGGTLVACSPTNGWVSHGFYQFGPELVYSYWKLRMGCDVEECCLVPEFPRFAEIPLLDKIQSGNRIRLRNKIPDGRVYLVYAVRKGPDARDRGRALQTDYVARWDHFDTATGREDTDMMKLRKEHLES